MIHYFLLWQLRLPRCFFFCFVLQIFLYSYSLVFIVWSFERKYFIFIIFHIFPTFVFTFLVWCFWLIKSFRLILVLFWSSQVKKAFFTWHSLFSDYCLNFGKSGILRLLMMQYAFWFEEDLQRIYRLKYFVK